MNPKVKPVKIRKVQLVIYRQRLVRLLKTYSASLTDTCAISTASCTNQEKILFRAKIHNIVSCIAPENAATRVPPSLIQIIQQLSYLNEVLNTAKFDLEWREHVFMV